MIEFLSSWAKNLGLAIIVVSILEMLLPNNKTKKYIRMVMGIYVLFTIVSPFLENKNILDTNTLDFEKYVETSTNVVNQTSMDIRIESLYIEQLEKDITKKLEQQGYEVIDCNVKANITDNENETRITKIKLDLQKSEKKQDEKQEENDVEEKIVTQIQKIKTIDTTINKDNNEQENENIDENVDENKNKNLSKAEIQNVKSFLIKEYGVSEKCLEIK